MMKDNVKVLSNAGNVCKEMKEIKKMQKSADSYWSMWSNTCADFLTIICC